MLKIGVKYMHSAEILKKIKKNWKIFKKPIDNWEEMMYNRRADLSGGQKPAREKHLIIENWTTRKEETRI